MDKGITLDVVHTPNEPIYSINWKEFDTVFIVDLKKRNVDRIYSYKNRTKFKIL